MQMQKTHLVSFLIIALVGAFASVTMLWVTANGLGANHDSTVYIETAKNLLAGDGFYAKSLLAGNGSYVSSEPMAHYPPVYPLLLAMVGLFGPDISQTGRLLHAFLYAANAILFGLSIYICTRRNWVATACAFLIYFSSKDILAVHSYAWSESPFITFSLAAFFLFSLHIASPRLPLLLMASGSLGLAIATRYVGIALLPPMLFGLLLFGNRPLRHRITDILIATSVASAPMAVWLIHNSLTAHTTTDRSFAAHPIGLSHLKDLIITLHDFVLPVPILGWVKAINLMTLAGALFLAVAIMHRRRCIKLTTDSVDLIVSSLGILFSLVYIALVLVSISFFDAHTTINERICLPVFVVLSVAAISLAWSLSHAVRKPIIWWSFILCVLVSVGINGIRATKEAIYMHTNGIGYNSRQWNESMTLSRVKSFGQAVIIYSNGPDMIRFKTDRDAIMIPIHTFPMTRKQNWNYQEQLRAMCKECAEGKAIVVYLNGMIGWRSWVLTESEMKLACELPILSQTEDGTIYGRNGKLAEQGAALGHDSVVHPPE